MKPNGWIDFKPDQAFAPAQCDAFTLVNGVPKVGFIFAIMDVRYVVTLESPTKNTGMVF